MVSPSKGAKWRRSDGAPSGRVSPHSFHKPTRFSSVGGAKGWSPGRPTPTNHRRVSLGGGGTVVSFPGAWGELFILANRMSGFYCASLIFISSLRTGAAWECGKLLQRERIEEGAGLRWRSFIVRALPLQVTPLLLIFWCRFTELQQSWW